MPKKGFHKWQFAARFRRNAFGWRSQPAIARIKEALSEIKQVARCDAMLGAEGAVCLLEKLSPAIEHVDSSSGSMGNAVNRAIEELVQVIAKAPAEDDVREAWLERLWKAFQEDQIPYLELLGDYWGELCVSPQIAARWADLLLKPCKLSLAPEENYFCGSTACLSSLLVAGRYQEILDIVQQASFVCWHYRRYGVQALLRTGRKTEALHYAEAFQNQHESSLAIAQECEGILLSSGLWEEAYKRYAFEANQKTTFLATFRQIKKKYPQKQSAELLADLVERTPGQEGKWFAAAKNAGLYNEAVSLAQNSPCDPKTLTRAARDFESKNPEFAAEVGYLALYWLVQGYGYEITGKDVLDAYTHCMKAAEKINSEQDMLQRVKSLVKSEKGEGFVSKVLGRFLER